MSISLNTLQKISNDIQTTPFYIYDYDVVSKRAEHLRSTFGDFFDLSYAIKANPNLALIKHLSDKVSFFDASSFHEVERALSQGVTPGRITWSGPGKRKSELTKICTVGISIVIESMDEIIELNQICKDKSVKQDIILRVNPDNVPRGFGAKMSGQPSAFGVDEDQAKKVIDLIQTLTHVNLVGFHAYTGSMCLMAEPIGENIENLCELFFELTNYGSIDPKFLIFGAGFGIPYHEGQKELDIDAVKEAVTNAMKKCKEQFPKANLLLELGRWIVGPSGALVSSVLSTKVSRGMNVTVCDAGFNNHLAACGMMGAVFAKNYPIEVIKCDNLESEKITQMLVGPLCTSIDKLASKIELPKMKRGDIIAIFASGAYGLTASPTRFISHPEPAEYAYQNGKVKCITEGRSNMAGSLLGAFRSES